MTEPVRAKPLAVRAFAALSLLLPRSLRREFGAETVDLFGDLYREARSNRGRVGAVAVWLRSAGGVVTCAWTARRDEGVARKDAGRTGPASHERGGDMMGGLMQDLRYAARSLSSGPGFAVTAILILAAGIGATTTIFSVVDAVVLEPLPYPDAGRLVHFDRGSHSYPNFHSWREMESFELLSAARDYQVDLTGTGAPERLPAAAVSEDFFRLFGGAPHLGRLFGADDFPGDRSVAVLSHGFWTRLGASEEIIGGSLNVDGRSTVVIGVLDPGFEPPRLETGSRVDLWFALDDGGADANDHGMHVLGVAARLRPGVALAAAQAEVDAERAAVAEEVPRQYVSRDGTIEYTPLVEMHEATVRGVSATLYLLLGATGMMLLIACANVANLFLARGTSRSREIALRGALGASRRRIAGQILTESVALSLVGGLAGIAVAFVGVDLLTRFLPGGLPRADRVGVDLGVMWFSVGVSVLTGVLFGTLPALQAMREDVNDALKDGAGSVTTSRRGRRVRSGLVVAEVALAVVLVAGAGLLFRSFIEIVQVEPGFETEGLVILPLELEAGYDAVSRDQFARELLASLEAMAEVRAALVGWTLPFTYTGQSRCCWRTSVEGDPGLVDEDDPFRSIIHPVSDGYFAALGAEIVAGRDFAAGDGDAPLPVAVLNRPAAEALFGSDDPVGRTIRRGDEVMEVVGVVAGVHHWGLSEDVEVGVYVPYLRFGVNQTRFEIAVRTDAPLEAVAERLRSAVWEIDPDLPLGAVTTMEARVGASLAEPRFMSGLLGAFALIAMVLAAGGVYGSMLYTVGQRRHEIGVRLALGADGGEVIGLVMRHGARLAFAGVVIGTGAGLWLSGLLRQLVWGVQPTDPITFVATAVVLGATALLSSFVPAWRAARTDPLRTLRAE